jgi:AraC-like DNA-binding protein
VPAVAALLEDRASLLALRRSLPKGGPRLVTCRSSTALEHQLERRLVEAIVVSPSLLMDRWSALRARFPAIPVVLCAAFRPQDASELRDWLARGVAIAVGPVDDAVLAELIARVSLTAERRVEMAEGPRALRLDTPIQRDAWEALVGSVERPVRTLALARRLGVSREHLSRQFGAGGAPNLKRVIDLTRIAAASQLLRNPGCPPRTVARVLGFSSAVHLSSTAQRIAGVSATGLARLGPRGVLAYFAKGKMRSRG